jgi:hypothetical protein
MVAENPTWGAPRIHGELGKLGFDVSERTVSRWILRTPRGPHPVKQWLTFLRNHREAMAAMDFFTVRLTFGVLHCFFVIAHDLLDHVIILNERHLKRLMSAYLLYYHEDRTYLGLEKDVPAGRSIAVRSGAGSEIQSLHRLGGLHHRYAVAP